MANAASGYVVPIGSGVASGIWGPGYDSHNYPVSPNGVFDIYDQNGNLDPRGPNASSIDAWNALRLGYGTVDAPDILGMGANEAMRRYAGDPQTGEGGWRARWDQWNATDVVGPDGVTLNSPLKQTGLRVSRDYGAERDPYGGVTDPWHTSMFQAALGIRNNLNQDRWLDPYQAMSGLRALNQDSPYAQPNAGDYLSTMRDATGGPGAADFYGQRGVDQTNALADTNIRQLNRNIDREMELSLGNQLPEISQAMEAAGLGRSGAGQLQMLQASNAAREQAIRDKNRTMADYTDREANRRASAINLGSQIGAQGYGQYSQQMGQAALAGLGDEFQMNQANRQNEQALWSQQMQNRYAKNQNDQSALFDMLNRSGAYNQNALQMENAGQSQALRDWLMLQQNRDQTQQSSLNQALQLANAQRQIQQDRLNQMIQAGMQPWETQLRIATGTTAPSGNYSQPRSFWDSNLGGAVANAGMNWALGGQGANAASQGYDYMRDWVS